MRLSLDLAPPCLTFCVFVSWRLLVCLFAPCSTCACVCLPACVFLLVVLHDALYPGLAMRFFDLFLPPPNHSANVSVCLSACRSFLSLLYLNLSARAWFYLALLPACWHVGVCVCPFVCALTLSALRGSPSLSTLRCPTFLRCLVACLPLPACPYLCLYVYLRACLCTCV